MKTSPPDAFSHASYTIGYASVANVVATAFFTTLIFSFYMAHYAWSSGFFTSAFTPLLAVLFFASVLFPFVTAITKAMTQRRDVVALVEWIGAVLFTAAAAWIFTAFPLNFSHLTDIVPGPIQFILSWINNDIGRIIVALALLGSVIALAVDSVKLAWRLSVRQYHKLHSATMGM